MLQSTVYPPLNRVRGHFLVLSNHPRLQFLELLQKIERQGNSRLSRFRWRLLQLNPFNWRLHNLLNNLLNLCKCGVFGTLLRSGALRFKSRKRPERLHGSF